MATQPSKRRPGRRPAEEGDAEATRHHILRHAWRLFNSQSYTSISMDEIARAAGVTKATLYYHFPGKADLLVASVQDWLTLSPELQTALVDQSYSVRQRLTMLINEWYRYDQEEYNEAI
ncbi:MAG: TetR/AcrR family transcriptional regulator, partial [Chloroflexaceae bacterium]|nr:TetR/AcrR family transcriptional regulator [Chloroflexaceae bacterium]